MDLIVSEKARAQGVTTKVSIVATVRPTTRVRHLLPKTRYVRSRFDRSIDEVDAVA